MARSSRVGSLVPKLRRMEPVSDLSGHQALVKHLQFSPDGTLLATSSWDRTSLICEPTFFRNKIISTYSTLSVSPDRRARTASCPSSSPGIRWSGRMVSGWKVSPNKAYPCNKNMDRGSSLCMYSWSGWLLIAWFRMAFARGP